MNVVNVKMPEIKVLVIDDSNFGLKKELFD